MLESLFNKVAGRKDLKETSIQMFSCECCKIFTKKVFLEHHPVVSGYLLFLIKNNQGWFLLKRLVDLVIVRYLHNNSRNHFNTLLLILQKTATCPK